MRFETWGEGVGEAPPECHCKRPSDLCRNVSKRLSSSEEGDGIDDDHTDHYTHEGSQVMFVCNHACISHPPHHARPVRTRAGDGNVGKTKACPWGVPVRPVLTWDIPRCPHLILQKMIPPVVAVPSAFESNPNPVRYASER